MSVTSSSSAQRTSLSLQPPAELLTKLTRLGEISEHVRDISRKIADLTDDPLPAQLESTVPGYVSVLDAHTAMLRRRHWTFIVAGNITYLCPSTCIVHCDEQVGSSNQIKSNLLTAEVQVNKTRISLSVLTAIFHVNLG